MTNGGTVKRFDILVVGELNIDLIFDGIAQFPELGKEVLADRMSYVMGSSSAILASNLASLGARVAIVGKVGNDDFGNFIIESLASRGVHTDYISVDESVDTGVTVSLNYQHNRTMITHKGAMDWLTLADLDLQHFELSQHLHLSSYYLQQGIRDDCSSLFETAQSAGLTTSFDTNWDPSECWGPEVFDVLRHVDVFLPNRDEALLISRQDSIEAALDTLSKYSHTVAIKLGKDGAVARHLGSNFQVSPFDVVAVDSIGAGDSFNAGFLFYYLQGAEIQQCLEFGNACGALSVTSAGGTATFQNPRQIERDMAEVISYAVKQQAG